jgi:hypothetical protein
MKLDVFVFSIILYSLSKYILLLTHFSFFDRFLLL